jgi:hypothetical protein
MSSLETRVPVHVEAKEIELDDDIKIDSQDKDQVDALFKDIVQSDEAKQYFTHIGKIPWVDRPKFFRFNELYWNQDQQTIEKEYCWFNRNKGLSFQHYTNPFIKHLLGVLIFFWAAFAFVVLKLPLETGQSEQNSKIKNYFYFVRYFVLTCIPPIVCLFLLVYVIEFIARAFLYYKMWEQKVYVNFKNRRLWRMILFNPFFIMIFLWGIILIATLWTLRGQEVILKWLY